MINVWNIGKGVFSFDIIWICYWLELTNLETNKLLIDEVVNYEFRTYKVGINDVFEILSVNSKIFSIKLRVAKWQDHRLGTTWCIYCLSRHKVNYHKLCEF